MSGDFKRIKIYGKILPINEKPFFTSYASYAKFLAMISTNNDYEEWFYTNYIQLISKKDFRERHDVPLEFFIDIKRDNCYYFNNLLLHTQCLKLELLNELGQNIIEFIINAIDKNFYVDICLNEYFIPVKSSFHRMNNLHDNLVYGYATQKGIFYMAGYIQRFSNQFSGTYGII